MTYKGKKKPEYKGGGSGCMIVMLIIIVFVIMIAINPGIAFGGLFVGLPIIMAAMFSSGD
jgi:hypothetical protein